MAEKDAKTINDMTDTAQLKKTTDHIGSGDGREVEQASFSAMTNDLKEHTTFLQSPSPQGLFAKEMQRRCSDAEMIGPTSEQTTTEPSYPEVIAQTGDTDQLTGATENSTERPETTVSGIKKDTRKNVTIPLDSEKGDSENSGVIPRSSGPHGKPDESSNTAQLKEATENSGSGNDREVEKHASLSETTDDQKEHATSLQSPSPQGLFEKEIQRRCSDAEMIGSSSEETTAEPSIAEVTAQIRGTKHNATGNTVSDIKKDMRKNVSIPLDSEKGDGENSGVIPWSSGPPGKPDESSKKDSTVGGISPEDDATLMLDNGNDDELQRPTAVQDGEPNNGQQMFANIADVGAGDGNVKYWMPFVIVGLFAMLVHYLLQIQSPGEMNNMQQVEIFFRELEISKTRFPNQRSELWRRSRIHLEKHLENAQPTEPVSLILTAGRRAERTLLCLAQGLASAFSSALNASVLHIDGASKAHQDSDQVKLDIDSQLRGAFEGDKPVAVIHRFEELPPGSTLIFYRYCDHENAAYKKTSLIFTVLLGEEEELPAQLGLSAVEEMVDDHLKKKFLSSGSSIAFDRMDLDKYSGLWSRISHLILPVVREERVEHNGC